jgi:hypothetical protein
MLMNLFQEPTMNLAPKICGWATRTIAPSMPSHAFLGSAAGGPRRGLVPQAPTVQICVCVGAPAAMLSPTRTRRRDIAARANLPLHRESRIYELRPVVHLPSRSLSVATASRCWPCFWEASKSLNWIFICVQKKCWNLCLKPHRRPIWTRKGDIPRAQISDEETVNHSNRLQLKFEDCFSTVAY